MKTLEELYKVMVCDRCVVAVQTELESLSYPVPGVINGALVERFFLFPNHPAALKQRPYAWLTVSSETGRLLQFAHCSVQDFAAPLQAPLTDQIDYSAPAEGGYRKLLALKRAFSEQYEMVRTFAFAGALTPEQREQLSQYRQLQDQVISPGAMEYYRMLSPEFYAWMEEQLK